MTPIPDTIEMPLTDRFVNRHIGPDDNSMRQMLDVVGAGSLIDLVRETIPESIRMDGTLDIDDGMAESEVLAALTAIAQENRSFRSFIGMGYYDTIVPPVIQRNILENPGW